MRTKSRWGATGMLRRWWETLPEPDKAILTASGLVFVLAAAAAGAVLASMW